MKVRTLDIESSFLSDSAAVKQYCATYDRAQEGDRGVAAVVKVQILSLSQSCKRARKRRKHCKSAVFAWMAQRSSVRV